VLDEVDFTWQDGSKKATFLAKEYGIYWLKVENECGISRDTVKYTEHAAPHPFSLGSDEILCPFKPTTLEVSFEGNEFDFTWQDGSKGKSFLANTYGVYWLSVKNMCGIISVDTIRFTQDRFEPSAQFNFISPSNGDQLNEYLVLDNVLLGSQFTVFNRWGKEVYSSGNYQNDWDGQGLPSGIYFYTVKSDCIETQKGTLTIQR
jgi:gliding motility-associated-like protein